MREIMLGKFLPMLAIALPLGISVQSQAEEWVALGFAVTQDEVAASVSERMPARAEAEASAINGCESRGVPGCKIAIAFNVGCGYITTGKGPEGTTGFAVAWGATEEAAIRNCLSQGAVSCEPPIGGCAD